MQRFDLGATISVILLIPSVGAFLLNYYLTRKSYSLISGQARPFLQPSRPFKKWAFTFTAGSLSLYPDCLSYGLPGVLCQGVALRFLLTFRHYDFPSLGGMPRSGPRSGNLS